MNSNYKKLNLKRISLFCCVVSSICVSIASSISGSVVSFIVNSILSHLVVLLHVRSYSRS